MRRTVLSVAYPLAPVSEHSTGGAEQVLAMLDRALVDNGDESLVVAAAGSQVRGRLFPLPAVPESITEDIRRRAQAVVRQRICEALSRRRVDIIHFHGVDCLDYLPDDGPAALITLHLPLAWYPAEAFTTGRRNTFLQGVSKAQQQTAPNIPLCRVIDNGVDLTRYQPGRRHGKYGMVLGRICPEKGIDIAIRACKAAGVGLLIGGRVYGYEDHQQYFAAEIEPLLGRGCRFLGELDCTRKSRLIAAAQCLLAPSLAPETSSLVAMEALASGTPVIAFRSGALPDVVEHGITGWIVESECEMTEAIARAPLIDRSRCRLAAVQRFDQNRTIREYFSLYDDICRWITSLSYGTTGPSFPNADKPS